MAGLQVRHPAIYSSAKLIYLFLSKQLGCVSVDIWYATVFSHTHSFLKQKSSLSLGIQGKHGVFSYGFDIYLINLQAAFDQRILSSVCFFGTDIHSATLGKGKQDDSLIRVRKGDLTGKGELVVRTASLDAGMYLLI